MLMDDIDRKILKLLQENARMSLKTIPSHKTKRSRLRAS